jgi:outer membrane receptor protein involved in Fe transport
MGRLRIRATLLHLMGSSASTVLAMSSLPIALAGAVATAEAAEKADCEINFDIAPQPMDTGLIEFSRQADLQVMVGAAAGWLDGQRTKGVKGRLCASAAIQKLLVDSDMLATINGNTVIIQKVSVRGAAAEPPSPLTQDIVLASDAGPFRVLPRAQVPGEISNASGDIDEVVVTGSHIRGSEVPGSKVTVIDRATMDKSGYGQLKDFLETVTQNFGGTGEDNATSSALGNSAFGTEIQLRGLGPGTTLTLINGQRLPGGGAQGGFVDISNIPTSAIERIEILTDGASAIYGSDAIGGVVNIILRKDLEGGETRLRLGTADGDADEIIASQLFGHSWSTGNFLVGYQFTQRDELTRGAHQRLSGDQRPSGGLDHRRDLAVQRGGAPGNILNSAGQVAYAIPSGQDGTGLTSAQLLPGAANYQDISYSDLLPDQKIHSAFASLSQQLGDRVSLLVDARYGKRDVEFQSAANGAVATVPSTNPFYVNPFGGTAPVRVEYDFTADLGPQTLVGTNETFSVAVAPTIELGAKWRLSLTGSYGEDRTDDRTFNRLDAAAVAAGAAIWSDTNRATALNVFGNGSANNPATLARIRLPDIVERAKNSAYSAGVAADGPLFALPAGAVKLAAGLAYHSDRWTDTANGFNSVNGTVRDSRNDRAAFAELTTPLVGKDQAVPLVRALDLSLAGRYDEYSDAGSTFNPKIGMTWRVVDMLRLRGTWGTSFRAPPFYLSNLDLRPPGRTAISVVDPSSPTGRTNSLLLTGVVRDLSEEKAELWTAGLDITPVEKLNISGTYFNIRYTGRIGTPINFNTVLVNPQQYAGTDLVIRNPSAAQVAAICNSPDFTGTCVGTFGAIIDNRRRNIAVTRMTGVDTDINYAINTGIGDINAGIGGTYLFKNDQAISPGSPIQDVLDILANPLGLRLRGTVSWNLEGWTVNAAVNYAGDYKVAQTATARPIGSWTTVDLGFGYEFSSNYSSLLNGTVVRFSATNAFDKLPPFVDGQLGFDTANGNIIGRTMSVQMTKQW